MDARQAISELVIANRIVAHLGVVDSFGHITVRNPELDRLAMDRPGDVSAAYRKAAAEELLQVRREALLEMPRGGGLVLDVDPARAADAVVGTYLDLKRRGRV